MNEFKGEPSLPTDAEQVVATMRISAVESGMVTVTGQRQGGCSSCQQRKQCPSGAFTTDGEVSLAVPTQEHFQVGDPVILSCSQQQLLQAFSLLFGLPLLGLLLMPAMAEVFTHAIALEQSVVVAAESLLGLALGLLVGRKLSHRLGWQLQISKPIT